MSILHTRPLVFVSSAIEGLEDIREALHSRLAALDLVDDWVFEIHATAGGEPAEGQYLDVAVRCDLDLLIIGGTRSQATEDEYAKAYADNPDKIIPIYVGDGSHEVKPFRRLIDGRHSRDKAADTEELLDLAVAAVERAVLEGRLTTRQLRGGFEARLGALDRLLDLDPGQSYLPRLERGTELLAPEALLEGSPRLAVTGIGGAGKTYGALVALHRLSHVRRRPEPTDDAMPDSAIPLYLRATEGSHALADLITAAFTAVRFFPGPDVIAQYARDGRLVLVIDGYDDLDAAARSALVRDVAAWGESHPRCRVIFLARTLPDHALSQFERVQPAPLDLVQLTHLFAAHGQQLRGDIDIPPEVADLVVRPFWAGALARFGLDVRSGLELIGRVIERRLELASDGEASEARRMRDALGELARSARPAVGLPVVDGLDVLAAWQGQEEVAARFRPIAANVLLDRLRNSGLIEPDVSDLVFVHPLIAARLAAEAAVARPGLVDAVSGDAELAAFAAALVPETQEDALLDLLATGDVFFLARVLRLSHPRSRSNNLESDLQRYQDALRRLSRLAGGQAGTKLEKIHVTAATDDAWLAVAHVERTTDAVQPDFPTLQTLAGEDEIVMWRSTPFATSAPELVAAAEVLLRFKRAFSELTETDTWQASLEPLPDELAIEKTILTRAYAVAEEERGLRKLSGAADASLPTLNGHPHLTATTTDWGRSLDETWDHPEPSVSIDPLSGQGHDSVARYLSGNVADQARERLRQQVESELGSALNSGAWNKPTALAGWVW